MATATTDTPVSHAKSHGRFAGAFTTIATIAKAIIDGRRQAVQMQRLMQMSDRDLTARGLSRETLVQHVLANSTGR